MDKYFYQYIVSLTTKALTTLNLQESSGISILVFTNAMGKVPLKPHLVTRPLKGIGSWSVAILLVSFVGNIGLVCDFCEYPLCIPTHKYRGNEDTKGQCVVIYTTSTHLHCNTNIVYHGVICL